MEETDFHSMKRKDLQALCKQHNIRANSTNLEMANNLTQLFKEKENQMIETIEVSTETESSNVLVSKKVKKVRFSPENELIEFTRTHKLKRSRRSVVLTKTSNLSVDNVDCAQELNGDSVDRTRLRGKALLENVNNVGKKGRKKGMVDDKGVSQVSVGKIEDTTVGMQLRGKTSKENGDDVRKRGKKRVIVDKLESQDGVGNDENGVGNRRSLRNKGIVSDGNLAINMEVKNSGKGKEEALHETQNLVRRSKRRVSTIGSSKLVVEGMEVGAHVTTKGKFETVVQHKEIANVELRRTRRKSVLPLREQVGNLEPELGNETALKPGGVVRTSRSTKQDPDPVSTMIETKVQLLKPCVIDKEASSVKKNTRRLKRHATNSLEVSDEFGGDDIIQRKKETKKKKKVNVSNEDVVIDDSSNSAQPAIGVSDVMKPSSTLEESNFVERSVQDDVIEYRESLVSQMSVPEVTSDFKQKHLSKSAGASMLDEIQDNSIVASTALTVMDENEPFRRKDLTCEKDFPEMVVEKAHLSLESDVEVSNEEIIFVADNDDVAAQMARYIEISTHANSAELTDNSNVCVNVISAENSLLADASSIGDQTDVKSDLEFVEAEADECGEPSSHVLDFVSEDKGVSAGENTGPVVPVFINDASFLLGDGQGKDMELVVAPSPCQDTEQTHKEYDSSDVNCLKESNSIADLSNEDTAEISGASKNSGGFDTLFDQCQSDDKNGVAETSREKLIVNNISGDNMFVEKTTMDAEHEATKKAEEIFNYPYEAATFAANQNCSSENEDSIEAQNAGVESFCDTVITELELGRRLSEGNFQDVMVTENQNGQIGKEDIITPNKPNEEDSCQGTKISNLETSMNKSTVTRGVCSSIKNEELNIDGEKGSECGNSINKRSLSEQEGNNLPVKFKASSMVNEASEFESILSSKTCNEDFCSVKDYIVIENKELYRDGEKENESEKLQTESSVSEREEHDLQLLFATPIKSADYCTVDEASGLEDVCKVKENVVIETMASDKIERGRAMEFEEVVTESLGFEATDHEVLDAGPIAGADETDLRLLFATPNKIENSYKVNGYCRSESKLEESCLEKVCSAKQQESHDKVAEDGYLEVFNTECSAGNDESDLQLLFKTPNKIEFSCEATQIRGSESKNALEECTVEKACHMKQNTLHEEVGVAGLELTNNLSPEVPNTEALLNSDILDNLACATDSPVNSGEEHVHSSGNLDTGSQNQIQVSEATLCDNLSRRRENEESVDERTADVEICIDDAIEKLEVTSLTEWKFDDSVGTVIQDQDLSGCNITTNIYEKLSEEELSQNGQENEFVWLFSTPNKSEAPSEANATRGSETKFQESCMEKASSTEPKASFEKVGDATSGHEVFNADCIAEQYEIYLPLLFATPSKVDAFCASECKLEESCMEKVASNNENIKDEYLNLVNGVEVANLEASKENWNGETFEQKKGTSSLSVEHSVSSGQIHPVEESKEDDKDSAEIISTMASPLKNRNESCDQKLLDIESSENLKLTQSRELRSGFANGDSIQKCSNYSGNNYSAAYSQGSNVKRVTSPDAFLEPSSSEMANDESGIDLVTEKENEFLWLFPTPNKSEAPCEANATRGSELQESCMEKASSTEPKASCEKVGDAISDHEVLKADCIAEQYEIDLPLLFATPSKVDALCASECKLEESCMEKVAPNNENMKDEDLNLVNGLGVANPEASKENWTGETFEQKKGTSSLSVERILSSGQTYLVKESKDDDKDSAEKISTLASPLKNRNESCDTKLLDIELAENLKLAQSCEMRSGFANGDTIQKCSNDSRNNYFAAYSQGNIVKRVTSTDAFLEPSSLEMANVESGIDDVTEKETGTTFLDEEPLFSNLEMHLLSGDNDYESSNCSHKDGKDLLGSSTNEIVNKLPASELHFQTETDSRFEVLKESDVMETIQEYTNYESSNSADIDRSGVTLPIKASTEASKISYHVDEPRKDSILDEVFVCGAGYNPRKVYQDVTRVSTAKKTARTILIHGTPKKALATADMKENDPLEKKPLIGNITITRPAKRRALQDIDYK